MNEERLVRTSKFLSKYLRHQPQDLGLTLQPGGWVTVDDLLAATRARNFPITRDELDEVVRTNSKQRFSFDESGTRIRANQGHSVEVDLQLQPVEPPAVLYHGTADRFLPSILREGLRKMARHHVHMSADLVTARTVGGRHGRAAVLEIDTARMWRDGHQFFRSENGVWLTDSVPVAYMRAMAPQEIGRRD